MTPGFAWVRPAEGRPEKVAFYYFRSSNGNVTGLQLVILQESRVMKQTWSPS